MSNAHTSALMIFFAASVAPGCGESPQMGDKLDRLAKRVDALEARQNAPSQSTIEPSEVHQRANAKRTSNSILEFLQLQINASDGWLTPVTTATTVEELGFAEAKSRSAGECHIHLNSEGEIVFQRWYPNRSIQRPNRFYQMESVKLSSLNPDSVRYETLKPDGFIRVTTTNNAPVVTRTSLVLDVDEKTKTAIQTRVLSSLDIHFHHGTASQLESALRDLILESGGQPDLYSADQSSNRSK